MTSQAHDFWQHQFLHTAGLPATSENVYFLTRWAQAEYAKRCDHNPIQLSQPEAGSTRCQRLPSGKYVRNYSDTASAAHAFSDQIYFGNYPNLLLALRSGLPFQYSDPAGVSADLHKWGSLAWQSGYEAAEGAGTTSPAAATAPHSKNVSGAWSRLMRVLAGDGHATIVELQRATGALNRIERRLRRA